MKRLLANGFGGFIFFENPNKFMYAGSECNKKEAANDAASRY